MTRPIRIPTAVPLGRLANVLKILAESGARSWWLYPLELPDIVDPLQYFAEHTGLVQAIGWDACQALVGAPFAKLRKEVRR